MSGVNDIRSAFLGYFNKAGHEIVSSSPLVPRNDPTLMFTNAGMVQFKNVFTGLEKRPYQRAVTSQKCVRAGGKHNDLDNVGYTARHHTFFEMLGNFSFGDYFKDRAIELAWNLVTKEFGLPKDKLTATVYIDDDQAFDLWKKIAGLPESRIIRIAGSDNFWAMGDTGPCGPCSEIFYDHGDKIPGGPPGSPDADGDRFIEIWNLVFMQYEQLPDGKRVDLPKPSIDTGMGLERIAAVLQGTHDNYSIDLFRALIGAIAELTKVSPDGPQKASHRVIADHLRASSFLIADGVLPSNEGRGYVLRRIMRRAMRHAELLGAREPLMWKLVPVLTREMGQAYPELLRAEALISAKRSSSRRRASARRWSAGFRSSKTRPSRSSRAASSRARPRSRSTTPTASRSTSPRTRCAPAASASTPMASTRRWSASARRRANPGKGRATPRPKRCGSACAKSWARPSSSVTRRRRPRASSPRWCATARRSAELKAGETGIVVVNQTPFYGESGGQVGDTGLMSADGMRFKVTDTQKKGGDLFVHLGAVEQGTLKVGVPLALNVDPARRGAIRRNHSATHLLHEALRQVLGDHVAQKGSLVAPDRLRFDFSHPKPMTAEELEKVEDLANDYVLQNSPVTTRLMALDDARASGARALFGEKYGDEVRVVAMGEGSGNTLGWSVELCGGTHVRRTGDIGVISGVSDAGVAAGVRRIEALTGAQARKASNHAMALARAASSELKVSLEDLPGRIGGLLDERKKLERELTDARKKLAMGGGAAASGGDDSETINGVKVMAKKLAGVDAKDLRSLADEGKKKLGSGVVILLTTDAEQKASLVVGVTDDLKTANSAVQLVQAGVAELGGKGGGGRPDMAQGGGPNGAAADAAFAAIKKLVKTA